MIHDQPESHPYRQWEGTEQWIILDRAVAELVKNQDLLEATAHKYVVGYLCRALASTEGAKIPETPSPERQHEALQAIRRAQELMRPFRRPGHSLVDELIAESREEAARE